MKTIQKNILDFLAAFPDREIWTDEEARLAASEYDHDALLAKSIEDDGEGAAYHVENDMTYPGRISMKTATITSSRHWGEAFR